MGVRLVEVCSQCGGKARTKTDQYAYRESGLDNVTLIGIDLIECGNCGNKDPVIPHINELRSVIAEALISKPARLSGRELRYLRKYLELSAREFSKLIHVDPSTLSKWENGEDKVGPQSDLVVRALIAAKKEENYQELVEKLNALDESRNALDIIIDTKTNVFEYAQST
jgi:putative zinc finger/helix-turn-helix YgiT family protein